MLEMATSLVLNFMFGTMKTMSGSTLGIFKDQLGLPVLVIRVLLDQLVPRATWVSLPLLPLHLPQVPTQGMLGLTATMEKFTYTMTGFGLKLVLHPLDLQAPLGQQEREKQDRLDLQGRLDRQGTEASLDLQGKLDLRVPRVLTLK